MSGIEPEAPAESSSLAAGATPASLLDGSQVHHITDVNGKSRIDEFEVRDLPKGGKKVRPGSFLEKELLELPSCPVVVTKRS
jgi:hypothetical protein